MKKLYFVSIALIVIATSSCSSLSSISNGAYSDISLNKNSNEYKLKRLNEINSEGKAFFGIPIKAKKRKGVIVRFNGIELGKSNQFLPILSMLSYTYATSVLLREIFVKDYNISTEQYILTTIAGIPVAGALNNITWSRAALRNASWNVNSILVEDNPGIDVFLNPKYEVEYSQGIFTQKAKVKAKVMGATIKTD